MFNYRHQNDLLLCRVTKKKNNKLEKITMNKMLGIYLTTIRFSFFELYSLSKLCFPNSNLFIPSQ